MAEMGFRPYVGALYCDGIARGSAFVCHATQMLITCAHCLEGNPTDLAWQRFDEDCPVNLKDWVIPVKDPESDVAIIINGAPLVPRHAVAELPRPPQTRGLSVYFDGLGELIEAGITVVSPDSGYGVLVGHNLTATATHRIKMESRNVTPGCSGAPVIYFSGIGETIVGMISGRYNSEDWNRDTVWLVTAQAIRNAISSAQGILLAASQESDPLATLDVEVESWKLKAYLKASDRKRPNSD